MSDPVLDALVAFRWVHFSAVFVVFGGTLFWLTAGRRHGPALPASVARTRLAIMVAAWVAALSGVGWLAATIADMTGGFDGLRDRETLHAFFLETAFGPIAVARLALLAMLAGLALRPGAGFVGPAILSGLLLVSQAWLGHAAEGGQTWLGAAMIAVYATHVLAAAAWIGGLPFLGLAIGEERHGGADATATILELLSRYSAMAMIAVALVVASGGANTLCRTSGTPGVLFGSRYGLVLAVKLALVAIMLTIAAINRFATMPRLARGATGSLDRLTAGIRFEMGLALAVVLIAALLGVTPPPV